MQRIPAQLAELIDRETSQPSPPEVQTLLAKIKAQHHGAVQAIVFYGSCLRTGVEEDSVVDLYALVDGYASIYRSRLQQLFNKLLPPNVFYLEIPRDGRRIRTKYAVVSLADFRRGASRRWFHSYFWGRFTQPSRLVYARDETAAEQTREALALAPITFITRVLPRLPACFQDRELWLHGLTLSYQAELRVERPEQRAAHIFDTDPDYYRQLTRAALAAVPFAVAAGAKTDTYQATVPLWARRFSRVTWLVRHLQGKLLSILRLIKSLFTFHGGLDYIVWKIERHSGVKIEITPFLRRYPLLGCWGVLWQLYRRKVVR